VQATPEITTAIDRLCEPAAPLWRQPSAQWGNADEHSSWAERKSLTHGAYDWNLSTEAKNVLRRLSGIPPIENPDSALW
jgi:hypothetical protein